MASIDIQRKDSKGHIISKGNKDYHICFKDIIDIVEIQSYKKYNKLIEDEENFDEDFFDESNNSTKVDSFIENYQKMNVEDCSSKDPKSFSKGGCNIF